MELNHVEFPPQQIPSSRKTKDWAKKVLQWADSKTFFNYSLVRKSVIHKKTNYDLMAGKIHMNDLQLILNPESIQASFVPERILHYPIINSKLELLKGEESKRAFDFKVVVTNPNSISEIEENKKNELFQRLQQWVTNDAQSDEEALAQLEKISDYFTYEWLDAREIRANCLLNHYIKEYNIPKIFNDGFSNAMIAGEEIYHCDIVGGEPIVEVWNPLKLRIFKSGYSNKIEDADIVIYEDYWNPGRIVDTYGDSFSREDWKKFKEMPQQPTLSAVDSMDNVDERFAFVNNYMLGDEITSKDGFFWDPMATSEGIGNSLLPYDLAGNIRVLQVYWKSRRMIKKVKSYDPQTGDEVFTLYPETYQIKKELGEEEHRLWINEAWEGIKIGADIYVNLRPRVVQYNRLSNPSRCHFGIIGSIYNMNDNRPFSMVDMMKPYAYLYDVIHDRLNKLIARSWGNLVRFDFSKKPKDWDTDKWMYYAKTMGMMVEDSFNTAMEGPATGKVAGGLNTASSGVINTNDGNMIQLYINFLEFIKMEMGEAVGITKQREGLISNRETVGGVERATLQSSHITEWIFTVHEDLKKRVLECILETAKIALKGRSKKFNYILSDGAMQIMNIDGDEFAESDYGLVVDNSNGIQQLNEKLDMLAQAALQNQTISFSTVMKMYTSCSLIEKQRMVERDEKALQERAAQQQQQEMQMQQQQLEANQQMEQMRMQQEDMLNQRDNETKILIATINAENANNLNDGIQEPVYSQEAKDNLAEKIREFDAKLKLERDKLSVQKEKNKKDAELKLKQINKPVAKSSSK